MSSPTGYPWEELVLPELEEVSVKLLYNMLRIQLGTEGYSSLLPEMFTIVIYLLITRQLLYSKHFSAWNEMKGLYSDFRRETSRPC